MQDLPYLKIMYGRIVQHMNDQNIQIWDDIYPCAFLGDDINQQQLYVLEDQQELLGAFVLTTSNQGADHIVWEDTSSKVLYIDRFGVHVNNRKKGIGEMMLRSAIRLYERFGFKRVEGYYDEIIDETVSLHEFGYEYPI